MAEGARLESVYRGNSIEGSNPSLSAISSPGQPYPPGIRVPISRLARRRRSPGYGGNSMAIGRRVVPLSYLLLVHSPDSIPRTLLLWSEVTWAGLAA